MIISDTVTQANVLPRPVRYNVTDCPEVGVENTVTARELIQRSVNNAGHSAVYIYVGHDYYAVSPETELTRIFF